MALIFYAYLYCLVLRTFAVLKTHIPQAHELWAEVHTPRRHQKHVANAVAQEAQLKEAQSCPQKKPIAF